MKKKEFKELSIKVLNTTKDAIMDDIFNYELDSISDFDDFVDKDIPYLHTLWEHAVSINYYETCIDDKNIKCLNTLTQSIDYLSETYRLYESDKNFYKVDKYALDSAEQVEEYVNYIRKKQSLLMPKKKTNKKCRV